MKSGKSVNNLYENVDRRKIKLKPSNSNLIKIMIGKKIRKTSIINIILRSKIRQGMTQGDNNLKASIIQKWLFLVKKKPQQSDKH